MKFKRIAAFCLAFIMLCASSSAFAAEWVAKMTSTTKVYASAKKDAKVLGTVKSGTLLTLANTKDGWAKIKLNGKTGYVKSGYVRKTTTTMYVKSASLGVYASARSSSDKLATLGYGADLKLEAVEGEWARVKNGSKVGFCKYGSLTSENPNTLNKALYVQEDGVNVYQTASSSSSVISTVKMNTKVTCVATYNDEWCRVKSGSKYGYIKISNLGATKVNPYSTAKPATAKSVEADWWKSDIQNRFGRGTTAIVTDVKTGISWKVVRTGGTNHADVQPKTAADTKAMKKAAGSDFGTWNRRAVWVSIGDKKYAASMNCMPHGEGSIKDNSFNGHHCIHFTNSRTHGSNKVDTAHQNAIKQALRAG